MRYALIAIKLPLEGWRRSAYKIDSVDQP